MAAVSVKKNISLDGVSPSTELVREKNKIFTTYDSLERELKIKIPTPHDDLKYDLYFGPLYKTNEKFYEEGKFALFIKEIDGNIVPFPTTENEILALMSRLGREGLDAIGKCVDENFIQPMIRTQEEEKDLLKK